MTALGKPLVFYLKYMAEMQRLYEPESEGGEPDLTGMADAEHVREMARTVGAAACEQAADFLELCGKGIEAHFTGLAIATLSKRTKRTTAVKDWFWRVQIRVPSVGEGSFNCGVSVTGPPYAHISLEKDVCGLIVPWLWAKGGRKGEDAVRNILNWAHSRGPDGLSEERGGVALAGIPIKAQPPESFDVDRGPLIAEVMKTIARIGAEETRAIASFVDGLNEPDES